MTLLRISCVADSSLRTRKQCQMFSIDKQSSTPSKRQLHHVLCSQHLTRGLVCICMLFICVCYGMLWCYVWYCAAAGV